MVCDLAQYYHIYDYHTVPVHTLAILVSGLDNNSRVKRAAGGIECTPAELFLAGIFDDFNAFLWSGKGKRPTRILPQLYSDASGGTRSDIVAYSDPEELRRRRKEIMEKARREAAERDKKNG